VDVVSSNTGSGCGSNFVAALGAHKSTQNLYFCSPSAVFFGTSKPGADHEELLALIIPLSSILTTWASISCLGTYWVRYWGRLTGAKFPNNIWCSMTCVHLKSLVSSSWNTCAYFSGWVQLTVSLPVKNDLAFLATACDIKFHFSFLCEVQLERLIYISGLFCLQRLRNFFCNTKDCGLGND